MEKVVIRLAQDSELDKCAEVLRTSFATVAAEFGLTKENMPGSAAFIQTERLVADKEKGIVMYVLEENDVMVGFVALNNKGDNVFELQSLNMVPAYRHKGYGKQLVDFCKEEVKKQGGTKISGGIIGQNVRAIDWFVGTNGFVHLGTREIPNMPISIASLEFNF